MQNTENRKMVRGPSYSIHSRLPEQDRWRVYGQAKRERAAMQERGVCFIETYDQFVRRITAELGI